jgi:uncharacterized membrane protein
VILAIVDAIFDQPFGFSQVWYLSSWQDTHVADPPERLIINCVVLTAAFGIGTSVVFAFFVERSYDCWEFVFTLFVFHLSVMAIVNGTFPWQGTFWTSFAGGVVLSFILTYFLLFFTERMDWKSNMGGKKQKKIVTKEKKEKKEHKRNQAEFDDPFAALAARIDVGTTEGRAQ